MDTETIVRINVFTFVQIQKLDFMLTFYFCMATEMTLHIIVLHVKDTEMTVRFNVFTAVRIQK